MEQTEWVTRCAGRLREHWRHAAQDELIAAAQELYAQAKWRRFGPEVAAVAWLRLGVMVH
jgi:hypothetical protein